MVRCATGLIGKVNMMLSVLEKTQTTATIARYTYGRDLTKNICEVFGADGCIKTAYTYTPHGRVTASGSVGQPIQWSSEYNDSELGLVYYNYRHYNPADGRWTGRDPYNVIFRAALYTGMDNFPVGIHDTLGLYAVLCFAYDTGRISGFDSQDTSIRVSIDKVFSGNVGYRNKSAYQNMEEVGPIPEGEYWIDTHYKKRHADDYWFKLYGNDGMGGMRYDMVALKDLSTKQFLLDASGKLKKRDSFNIHTGLHSNGCVTIKSDVIETDEKYPFSKDYSRFARELIAIGERDPFLNPRNPHQRFTGLLYVTECESSCEALMEGHIRKQREHHPSANQPRNPSATRHTSEQNNHSGHTEELNSQGATGYSPVKLIKKEESPK